MPKKLILPALIIFFYTITNGQSAGFMMGTWKSTGGTTLSGNVTSTIQINDVTGESFTGTKTSEFSNAKIIISISGSFRARGLYLYNGEVVQKQGQWNDCSACREVNKMVIRRDSIILVDSISGCDNNCDGITFYYRLFNEYDSSTQQYLVNRFGRPADILAFQPYQPKINKTDPVDNIELVKKDISGGTTITYPNAETTKKEEKRRRDSLDNIARIKQQRLADSATLSKQKKRQQDSLNLAQQKEQQHIKDSLDMIARLEKIRLRTEDSLRDVQAKKRQQEIADSINLAHQKEQQRIKDSLNNAARLRQQQTDDSVQLAQQKKREQETADSLNLAQQKEQQRINDSLQSVAAANLQKQRTADSLRDAEAAKRQQEITDSLAAARKQQYNDSLQKAAMAKVVPPPAKDNAADALTSRTSILLETYHITSPDILIELFDNGEIDGDIVSVYHNKENIVSHQTLGTKPITLNIHADATNREHEFVLVAENLGSIPPNSALMRVTAGKQVYSLSVNTDMKTNARIVFYYDGN